MKGVGAGLLTFCLVMTGLLDPRAQAVSIALEAPQSSANTVIRVEGDRLTVKLKEAPLQAVLEEIGRQGHINVIIQGPIRKTVSIEFQQIRMEEGLRRLLRGCGWMSVGGGNGTMEQLVVAETPEGLSFSAPHGPAPLGQLGPSSGPEGSPTPMEERGLEPVRAVAALMERDTVKKFFDLFAHSPDDPAVILDAFGKVVESLSLEDVGALIRMLKDKTMPLSKWEEALTPLADAVTAQERSALVRSLQDRRIRDVVLKSFEQVQLFKMAQAREAREAASR